MRRIAVRIDDVTPGMDKEKFFRFIDLIESYGLNALLGVIPDNRDESSDVAPIRDDKDFSFIRELKDKGYPLAMHGCFHVYTSDKGGLFPLNDYSEFADLKYDEQLKLIKHGKECLKREGLDTDIFMAPAHSFDKTSLKALKKCGFKYVTDGFGIRPYSMGGLVFLTISLLKSIELRVLKNGITTFVVHTGMMEEKDFKEYEELLKCHGERFCRYEELFEYNAAPRSRFGHYTEYALAALKHFAGRIM